MSLVVWLLVPLVVLLVAGPLRRRAAARSQPPPRELVRRAVVVLPSDDDQRAVLRAVSRVLDTDPRADVLVVESSPDRAAGVDAISPRVSVLRDPSVSSATEALHTGAARALMDGYDAVIELSIAHSRLARRITPLLEALDDGAHVAVGSRYVPGGRVVGCPTGRRIASRSANAALRLLTGVPVADVTAHVRAYRRVAVERALLCARGRDRTLGIDVMLHARGAGLRVTEVPVTVAGPVCAAVTPAMGREVLARALRARGPATGLRRPALIDLTDASAPVAGS